MRWRKLEEKSLLRLHPLLLVIRTCRNPIAVFGAAETMVCADAPPASGSNGGLRKMLTLQLTFSWHVRRQAQARFWSSHPPPTRRALHIGLLQGTEPYWSTSPVSRQGIPKQGFARNDHRFDLACRGRHRAFDRPPVVYNAKLNTCRLSLPSREVASSPGCIDKTHQNRIFTSP